MPSKGRKAKGCGHSKGGVGWCAKCLKDAYNAGVQQGRRQLAGAIVSFLNAEEPE